jgi:hypothetical protein
MDAFSLFLLFFSFNAKYMTDVITYNFSGISLTVLKEDNINKQCRNNFYRRLCREISKFR